ncbi:MAG: hypothetical protein EA351_08070 [Gemmatimonadales bacterium]|nr:MAG: hypothetical protein EA351_08070 [Gemmatimonadales bacterium]
MWSKAVKPLRSLAIALCAFFPASCGEPGIETERGDPDRDWQVLSAVDSIWINEGEDAYIGDPFNMVLVQGARGAGFEEIWVSDIFSKSLLHFDGDGEFVKRVGSPGPGPEEFSQPYLMFRTDDGQVAANDARQYSLKWFDAETGALNATLRYDIGMIGQSVPVTRERESEPPLYVFPLLDTETQTSLAAVDPERGTIERFGELTERHREAPARNAIWFTAFFGVGALVELESETVLTVFGGDETLLVHDLEERTSRELGAVPVRFRRGVDGDCVLRGHHEDLSDCGSPFEAYSSMWGAWALNDGRVVIAHLDTVDVGGPGRTLLQAQSFVTILDPSTDEACVDLEVPVGEEVRAIFTVQDNDLYALDRRLPGTHTESWLLRFELPARGDCPAEHRVEGWLADADP